jgi:hypothetical protein
MKIQYREVKREGKGEKPAYSQDHGREDNAQGTLTALSRLAYSVLSWFGKWECGQEEKKKKKEHENVFYLQTFHLHSKKD